MYEYQYSKNEKWECPGGNRINVVPTVPELTRYVRRLWSFDLVNHGYYSISILDYPLCRYMMNRQC